jgi:hypothetical protein
MTIGHETWHVEVMKLARVWAMDNAKVNFQGIGLGSLDFFQNLARWREL